MDGRRETLRRIVQIAPDIGPGSGVAGVAYNLEREWKAQGIDVFRFTMREAAGAWIPQAGSGIGGKLVLLLRVVWFSTVGTLRCRRLLRSDPDLVSLCHNDVMIGHVYVNHGNLVAAMRSRGSFVLRMMRNPLHLFTAVRDRRRYGPRGPHRLVVNLTTLEDRLLEETFPRLSTPTTVIGNGVDLEAFACPDDAQRREARAALGLAPEAHVLLFIGHEFDRKGLDVALDALAGLPSHHRLVVVGGTDDLLARAASRADRAGVRDRVDLAGQQPDPRPWLRSADVFVLPTAYESYGLVVLEALACGVPVVTTATGCAPDVIVDGVNGHVVQRTAGPVADAVLRLAGQDREALALAARSSAEQHGWSTVAARYLEALDVAAPVPPGRQA